MNLKVERTIRLEETKSHGVDDRTSACLSGQNSNQRSTRIRKGTRKRPETENTYMEFLIAYQQPRRSLVHSRSRQDITIRIPCHSRILPPPLDQPRTQLIVIRVILKRIDIQILDPTSVLKLLDAQTSGREPKFNTVERHDITSDVE